MKKTFKYRIYANKEVLEKADKWIELCRNLYNCALANHIYAFKMQRVNITGYKQSAELPEIKKEHPEYKVVGSQVLQEVLERLDGAYRAFFNRFKRGEKAGYPRFRGKNRYNSFTLKNCGWKLNGKYLSVYNLGRFKLKLSRSMEGNIKVITIKRTPTNKWYAMFSCDNVVPKLLPQSDNVIGLDVGIKSFLTDSEGNHIENPQFLKRSLKELRVKHRAMDRSKKGSNRRKKTILQLSKCYEKIANQRRDFNHKLANQYIKKYGVIVFEKLMILNMVKNRSLARDIGDCAWGQFFRFLDYKAEYAGRIIIKDNPRNTSKMCHVCGAINKDLKLSDRDWVCQVCGTLHDRDENAAINHKNEGLKYLERLGQSHQESTYAVTQSVS